MQRCDQRGIQSLVGLRSGVLFDRWTVTTVENGFLESVGVFVDDQAYCNNCLVNWGQEATVRQMFRLPDRILRRVLNGSVGLRLYPVVGSLIRRWFGYGHVGVGDLFLGHHNVLTLL